MNGTLCFCVSVFGEYRSYIPVYIYSILKSYPDAYVKILLEKTLSVEIKNLLRLLPYKNYVVKENYWQDNFSNKFEKKARRWMIPESEFDTFEYAYIGDVDFLIVKEKPSLLELHIAHCNKIGLPFSNEIRITEKKRITGLHFIKVKEYYAALKIDKSKWKGKSNEEILYLIIEDSFPDFKEKLAIEIYRPHHGFHLGLTRGGKNIAVIKKQIGDQFKYYHMAKEQYLNDMFLKKCYINKLLKHSLERFYELEDV